MGYKTKIRQGWINLIPSKQFGKLRLKLKHYGTIQLQEICFMLQQSLEVHPSLKIVLVEIYSEGFEIPSFTNSNQDQIFISLEPNETFLFDYFVISIVEPSLYNIQFGKTNSDIQLTIITEKILVFDDFKQETSLLEVKSKKIINIKRVVHYKSNLFQQRDTKVKILQDSFFQLTRT